MLRIELRGRLLSLGPDSVRMDGAHRPDDFNRRVFTDWIRALEALQVDGEYCYLLYRFDDDYNEAFRATLLKGKVIFRAVHLDRDRDADTESARVLHEYREPFGSYDRVELIDSLRAVAREGAA